MTRVIVFDFDGVIVPSEPLKQSGYERIFSEFGEQVPFAAIAAARKDAAAHKSRVDVIRAILVAMHYGGDLEAAVSEYVARYGRVVDEPIRRLVVREESRALLERLFATYPLYINSNTLDEPLHETLRVFDIEKFFTGVYGASMSKLDSLRQIAAHEKAAPGEIVFIGDGEGDRAAATEFGCRFIGIATDLNGWHLQEAPFPVVDSVRAIEQYIV